MPRAVASSCDDVEQKDSRKEAPGSRKYMISLHSPTEEEAPTTGDDDQEEIPQHHF